MRIVSCLVSDGRGLLPVVWFNQPWIEDRLRSADEVSLFGAVRRSREGPLQLVNPELEELVEGADERIVPVYPSLGPIAGRRLRRVIERCFEAIIACEDPLPEWLQKELEVPVLSAAIGRLHRPEVPGDEARCEDLVRALNRRSTPHHRRLAVDELLAFACGLAEYQRRRSMLRAPRCRTKVDPGELARRLVPFELTPAQHRVVAEIGRDLGRSAPMARLIQGDVGSGKTVVAAIAILMVLEAGHQAALMAPTELLAEQHSASLRKMFECTPFEVHLLTSSVIASERRRVMAHLDDGSARLVVGTHALIEESVNFRDLGLAVVDEQQRFGVVHRQALVEKGEAPHLLVMTATPIPRSLALTVYGDLELSVIDQLPPGRRPVTTVMRSTGAKPKLYSFLERELDEGGRAYLVYPLIDASEELAAPALEDHVDEVRRLLPAARLGVLHGRLHRSEREEVFRRFASGEIQVLMATTVVEVGVDVPEASVMVIEGADRFGLSQLHQLRGRVGRGRRRAWCVLLCDDSISEDSRRRLELLCTVGDGFEIAEADLRLRGSGALTGTRQWGPTDFRFVDLARHRDLIVRLRELAHRLGTTGELDPVRSALARYHPRELELPPG
jgi:ATP-dependent DNA helicase RecG